MNIDHNQSKFEITDSDSNESQKINLKSNTMSNNLSINETSQQYSSSTNLTEELKIQNDIDDIDTKKSFCCRFHDNSTEQERLGSHPALPTLLRQSIGPLCSQIVNSMYLIVDSFWVSHSIGGDGLAATGAVSLIESANNAFGLYLLSCTAARISYLFGQKKVDECAQLFVDIIRISWIFSVILHL